MTGETEMSLAVVGRKRQTVQTTCHLAKCSFLWNKIILHANHNVVNQITIIPHMARDTCKVDSHFVPSPSRTDTRGYTVDDHTHRLLQTTIHAAMTLQKL